MDYKLVDNEVHLTIDGKGNIELLQSIYNNLRKIKNNKSACDCFMKFAQISTFYQNEYTFSKQITDAGVKYTLEFTEHSAENLQIINIVQNIWNERYNFPDVKDNEAGYYEKANEIVQNIEIDSDKEKPPTKARLRTVCNKLILELIPQYLGNPKYKEGGFNQGCTRRLRLGLKKFTLCQLHSHAIYLMKSGKR